MSYPVIDMAKTGQNIAQHREACGLSVRDLQDYFGFEYPQAIYKWQNGKSLPSVDNLLALARVLGVKMEDLLVYEDQEVLPFVRPGFLLCILASLTLRRKKPYTSQGLEKRNPLILRR